MLFNQEYTITQALSKLDSFDYDKRQIDKLDINTKNSLIRLFKSHSIDFVDEIANLINLKDLQAFIDDQYETSEGYPNNLKGKGGLEKLATLLNHIINQEIITPDKPIVNDIDIKPVEKVNITAQYSEFMSKYPQYSENMPTIKNIDIIPIWVKDLIQDANTPILKEQLKQFMSELKQILRSNNPTTKTEIMIKDMVTALKTALPSTEKQQNFMVVMIKTSYDIHLIYDHRLNETIMQQYYAKSGNPFIYKQTIGKIATKPLYIGETMQDNITIETENVSWLEMEVFYNMLGSRNNNHDSEFDNTIIDTAILNSNTWCSSGLASYISSFVFTCQLLMNVLIYNHKDEKKCPQLIEEALNEPLILPRNQKSKFKALITNLRKSNDLQMILLLEPQLLHFRQNKGLYGDNYKVAPYIKSPLKQYNIACFYGLCLTQEINGRYLINETFFKEFNWKTYLKNQLHTKTTFPDKRLVQAFETLAIQQYRPIGNYKQKNGLNEADKLYVISQFLKQSNEVQEQMRKSTSINIILVD